MAECLQGAIPPAWRPGDETLVRIHYAQFSVTKSNGICNYVYLNDVVILDRQTKCQSQAIVHRDDQANVTIHKGDMRESCKTRVGECFCCDVLSAMNFDSTIRRQGVTVSPTDHGRIEHRDQRIEIAGSRSREKRLHYLPLTDSVAAAHRILTMHAMASTASQFLCRDRGSPDDSGNLIERHSKDIVKYKCQPLGRGQRIHDNQ